MADSPTAPEREPTFFSSFRNWMSLGGLALMLASVFSFLLLFLIDSMSHGGNPYIGVLTYLVSPSFLMLGALFVFLGGFLRHRKVIKKYGDIPLRLDLSKSADRRMVMILIPCAAFFLLVSAVGVYHSYQYTESIQFCGQACHEVMKPERVAHQRSVHARIPCSECHIGPGATWFVRSKLSGSYQVYAVLANKFPRPIPTPIKNLRPARETCEHCHWPQKFTGNVDRVYNYFQGDESNTPSSLRLTLKVGGADSVSGRVGGIHWHVNPGRSIQYYASDEARQTIPWVRVTDAEGHSTEYRAPKFTNQVDASQMRSMDCMDCHNRPAHKYLSPETAVNQAMAIGSIDPALPWIKTNAVYALTRPYKTEPEALEGIAKFLVERYPDRKIDATIAAVQSAFSNNLFPEMKAGSKNYPDNIGHKDWPGCFRCHDGKHATADKSLAIKAGDCNTCHTILAQGSGEELSRLTPAGQPYKHPGGDYDASCVDCHGGGL